VDEALHPRLNAYVRIKASKEEEAALLVLFRRAFLSDMNTPGTQPRGTADR